MDKGILVSWDLSSPSSSSSPLFFFLFGLLVARIMAWILVNKVLLHVPCCRARESRSALQGSAAGQDERKRSTSPVVCWMTRYDELSVCLLFLWLFFKRGWSDNLVVYAVCSFDHRIRCAPTETTWIILNPYVRPCAIWASPIQNPAFRLRSFVGFVCLLTGTPRTRRYGHSSSCIELCTVNLYSKSASASLFFFV